MREIEPLSQESLFWLTFWVALFFTVVTLGLGLIWNNHQGDLTSERMLKDSHDPMATVCALQAEAQTPGTLCLLWAARGK